MNKTKHKGALRGLAYYLDRLHDYWLRLKLRKRPYRDYYKAVMAKETLRDAKYAVGGNWDENGKAQLSRLQMHGLKPHHTLLDIGCGSLRGGLHFIQYLDQGNYFGLDISEDALRAGKKHLNEAHLEYKKPTLLLSQDNSFSELGNKKFDFLHAQSVLSHMPKEDIPELFKNLPKIMNPESKFYATFFESKDGYYPTVSKRNFFYPFSMLESIAQEHDLKLERDENVRGLGKQQLILITRKI